MTWKCAAYKNSLTIFSNGVSPCCLIDSNYRKPMTEIGNRNLFEDLQTGVPPQECKTCIDAEQEKIPSYRTFFNKNAIDNNELQFLDIRNTNLCNLKCRSCNADASSQWAAELGLPITHQSLDDYYDIITVPSVRHAYFTGGEPFINGDHWAILKKYIESGQAKNIALMYNTNLTTLKYKDASITDIWKEFKSINVTCSIDAIEKEFEYIRSGASWEDVNKNLQLLASLQLTNLRTKISPTVSILNFWHLPKLLSYFKDYQIELNLLNGPDFLNLNAIPDELQTLAIKCLAGIRPYITQSMYDAIESRIQNNYNKTLIIHTISHVLFLDKIRKENLFDSLPFHKFSKKLLLNV